MSTTSSASAASSGSPSSSASSRKTARSRSTAADWSPATPRAEYSLKGEWETKGRSAPDCTAREVAEWRPFDLDRICEHRFRDRPLPADLLRARELRTAPRRDERVRRAGSRRGGAGQGDGLAATPRSKARVPVPSNDPTSSDDSAVTGHSKSDGPSPANLIEPTRSIIPADRACIRCSYNLRGLPTSALCPECGTPVEQSLRGHFLAFAAPEYLDALRRGLDLILNGMLLYILALFGGLVINIALASTLSSPLRTQPRPDAPAHPRGHDARRPLALHHPRPRHRRSRGPRRRPPRHPHRRSPSRPPRWSSASSATWPEPAASPPPACSPPPPSSPTSPCSPPSSPGSPASSPS